MTCRCVVFRAQCVPSRVPLDPTESTAHRSAHAATVASATTSAVSVSAWRASLEKGTCRSVKDLRARRCASGKDLDEEQVQRYPHPHPTPPGLSVPYSSDPSGDFHREFDCETTFLLVDSGRLTLAITAAEGHTLSACRWKYLLQPPWRLLSIFLSLYLFLPLCHYFQLSQITFIYLGSQTGEWNGREYIGIIPRPGSFSHTCTF